MRKPNLLKETQKHRMLETAGLNSVQGANLITVDIQPEYQNEIYFLNEYINFLNNNIDVMNSNTFLYNGESFGMISESNFIMWLIDNGLSEDVINQSRFYDKGYAFFRYCMDEGIDDNDVVTLIQYMIRHDINDSREIDKEMWINFMQETDVEQSDVKDLLEVSNDMISIPDLMSFLKNFGGKIILTGGGIDECLREVEIALMALEKPYNILTQYIY